MNEINLAPKRFRVLSFSDRGGFSDVEDFDASLAVTQQLNDDRHLEATAIHANIDIAMQCIDSSLLSTNEAVSWELRMDITVTHSTNGTYFMAVGWAPGGYSGIQQTPDTRTVPTGKNLVFSMWNSNSGNVFNQWVEV